MSIFSKKPSPLVVLILGDVFGKIGRRALQQVLPVWRRQHHVDLVIANVENLAHGSSMTAGTWEELKTAGVDVGTGGNHTFRKPEGQLLLSTNELLVRPANYSGLDVSGLGERVIPTAKGPLLVTNVVGDLFMKHHVTSPVDNAFSTIDEILARHPDIKMITVDFHGEASSEKRAFGFHVDGRVSAVTGSHTHIPTADAELLPHGTAYVTDVGLVGAHHSILGLAPEPIVAAYLAGTGLGDHDIPESGPAQINAVLLSIDPTTGRAVTIERLDTVVVV
ncbi:MAG: TIGR00282 family metallophosphoesterase [Patescibacteria group bacterium]